MMQTDPGHATAYPPTSTQDTGHHSGVGNESLTPAERIALTIALLNRGLDLMDGLARISLTGRTRGAFRGPDAADPKRHTHIAT